MNMHKWLLTNFDVSCLYVRERKHLIDAFSLTASYVRNAASDSGLVVDYRYHRLKYDLTVGIGRSRLVGASVH